jgi:hypothetical protein
MARMTHLHGEVADKYPQQDAQQLQAHVWYDTQGILLPTVFEIRKSPQKHEI